MSKPAEVTDILDYLTPFVVTAGRYSLEVQGQVKSQQGKSGMADAFGEALTDADLSGQAFIEVAMLARFPHLRFFGEEHEQSYNMKYFSDDAELCVYLDPVDGTLFYKDGLDSYNVIATLGLRV